MQVFFTRHILNCVSADLTVFAAQHAVDYAIIRILISTLFSSPAGFLIRIAHFHSWITWPIISNERIFSRQNNRRIAAFSCCAYNFHIDRISNDWPSWRLLLLCNCVWRCFTCCKCLNIIRILDIMRLVFDLDGSQCRPAGYVISHVFEKKEKLSSLTSKFSTFIIVLTTCLSVSFTCTTWCYYMHCSIPFLIFGGFFLNAGSVPSYFIWLSYLSWFRYGNEALTINQWTGVDDIICTRSNTTCPTSGKIILETLNFDAVRYDIVCTVCAVELLEPSSKEKKRKTKIQFYDIRCARARSHAAPKTLLMLRRNQTRFKISFIHNWS